PVDPTITACHVGGPNGPLCGDPQKQNLCDTSVCPTRWSELTKALDQYVQDFPLIGRYALSLFPQPEQPRARGPSTHHPSALPPPPGDDDGTVPRAAHHTRAKLGELPRCNPPGPTCTGGGTPTSLSLAFLTQVPELIGDATREQIVILFTDGLPNCNA